MRRRVQRLPLPRQLLGTVLAAVTSGALGSAGCGSSSDDEHGAAARGHATGGRPTAGRNSAGSTDHGAVGGNENGGIESRAGAANAGEAGTSEGGTSAGGVPSEGGHGPQGHAGETSGRGPAGHAGEAGAATAAAGGVAAGGESGARNEAGAAGDEGNQQHRGVYDPEAVHLWGTLDEGLCYRGAIAPVLDPNQAVTGFACASDNAMPIYGSFIHPTKRRLLFILNHSSSSEVLLFVADGDGTGTYPTSPHANDEAIPTVCNGSEYGDGIAGVFVTPDTGEVVYACSDFGCGSGDCRYFRASGDELPLPADHVLLDLGYGGSALLASNGNLVLQSPSGEFFPLDADMKAAFRAFPSGFWVARAAATGTSPERYSALFDGTFSSDGQFPEPPVSTAYGWRESGGDFSQCRFDGAGALFCFAESSLDSQVDQIVRADLGAQRAAVVYTEAAAPLVRIHIAYLVTGP
jgi:hypothetical protein